MTDSAETRWESHNEAGRRLFGQGDHAAAEQEFIAAIREATLLGADNVRLASSLSSLGQIKYRQKDLEQAEALFRRALAIRERVLGAEHFSLVQAINNLATLHYSRGELDQAAKYFARALEICDRNLGEKHPDVAVTLNNLARLHFRRNDFVAAAPLLMRLLAIKQEAVGAHHPEVAVILTSLAKVRLAEGQHEDAEQLARRALLIREEIHQPGDPAIAASLEALADVMAARGLLEDEQRLRKRAVELRAGGQAEVEGSKSVAASAGVPPRTPSARPAPESVPASSTMTQPAHQAVALQQAEQAASQRSPQSGVKPTTQAAVERMPSVPVSGANAAPLGGANAPPQAEPLGRERTTRSASLPWIEPPTSPALRRPNSRPITAPRPAADKAATPVPAARAVTPMPHATPAKPSPRPHAAPQSSAVRGPISHGPARARRDVILEEREAPRGRSGLKVAIVAAVLLGCGTGAWLYLAGATRAERITSSAGATLDPSSARSVQSGESERASVVDRENERAVTGARGAAGARPNALTASSDPAYGATPPLREAPPVAAYSEDARSGQPVRTGPQPTLHDADAGEMATTIAAPTPDLSRINVERITTAIGNNAKARADSLSRKTVSVKPPDFGKP